MKSKKSSDLGKSGRSLVPLDFLTISRDQIPRFKYFLLNVGKKLEE